MERSCVIIWGESSSPNRTKSLMHGSGTLGNSEPEPEPEPFLILVLILPLPFHHFLQARSPFLQYLNKLSTASLHCLPVASTIFSRAVPVCALCSCSLDLSGTLLFCALPSLPFKQHGQWNTPLPAPPFSNRHLSNNATF